MNPPMLAAPRARLKYIFVCPICRKRFSTDDPGEPACTGPSEMRDDHVPVVMKLESIERQKVSPVFAERRAMGKLLMPDMTDDIARESRIILQRDLK